MRVKRGSLRSTGGLNAAALARALATRSHMVETKRERVHIFSIASARWFPPVKRVSSFRRLKTAVGTSFNNGRYEANAWQSSSMGGRGKQLYLGMYNTREEAATVHDRAVLILSGGRSGSRRLNYEESCYDPVQLTSVPQTEALKRISERGFGISTLVKNPYFFAEN